MNISKPLRVQVIKLRQPLILFGISFVGLVTLLFARLASLAPGLSPSEARSLASSSSLKIISQNPLNLPYKFATYLLLKLDIATVFTLRSISALFTLVMIYLFYYVLRHWYAQRTALLGTALFATSSWLLHYARLAQPDILYIVLIAALAYGTWIKQSKKTALVILVGAILAVFIIYIPGLIWLVVFGGWWQRKNLLLHYKHYTVFGAVVITLAAATLVPLIYGLTLHPALIRQLLGFQLVGNPAPLEVITTIVKTPYQLFVHADISPVTWLGNVSLLDVFAIAMLILGIYSYYFMKKLDRAKVLLGITVAGIVMIGFGVVNLLVLLPVLYILVASGIGLMLQQWFTVFPRNPLAGLIGTTLISLAVLMTMFYHVNHYFIAWPNAPATKQVFIIRFDR